ncbi:MAG: hypothetical protein IJH50_06965 [Kiritimatiellae bacterium]|nr:hypothetical protein [Kiritimatiellia bacterium]
MAWNQPNNSKNLIQRRQSSKRHYGGIAFFAIAATLLMAFVFFAAKRESGKNGEMAEAEKPKRIAEVAPTVVAQKVEVRDEEVKVDPDARPTKPGQKLNGYVMLPNGELHKIRGEIYSNANREKPKYAVFKYPAENIIAGILAVKPGSMVVGNARDYRGKFIESFNKSLFEPIIVNEDDSEYVKEIKNSVVAAKKELKAAMDRGEDIEKIIKESRDELQRLASYKKDIRRDVLQYLNKEAASVEDAEDMFSAANKMLEAKGITPLADGPLVRIKLKMTHDM